MLSYRTAGDPKLYCIRFPDYKKLQGIQKCESTGNETILDMVKRKFQKVVFKRFKPKFENMLFFDENDNCLNVGIPAGVLSTAKTYKCVFKKALVHRPSDFRRDLAAGEYNETWELKSFLVSFTEINSAVNRFSKIVHNKMQVPFFNGETMFKALSWDNRFNKKVLRHCQFTCEISILTAPPDRALATLVERNKLTFFFFFRAQPNSEYIHILNNIIQYTS